MPRDSALSVVAAACVLFALPTSGQRADSNTAQRDLLARAAVYVQRFEDQFSTVISTEVYEQHAEQRRDAPPKAWLVVSSEARSLRSEVLLTRIPGRQAWLTVRNVLSVDGAAVPESADRLERALAAQSPGVLQALANEGARFNLGRIRRNVNDPTLALRSLSEASQAGFEYALQGREDVNGATAWKLTFRERGSPTLVQSVRNEDLPASGAIWLSAANDVVLRTSLILYDPRARLQATTTVDYGRDAKLDMWVPVRMSETYIERTGNIEERVVCTATYSNFRRFETSGRLVAPR